MYPVIQKEEEGEETPEEPVVQITEELLGFAVIDLKPYLANPELTTLQQKYAVFEYTEESVFKNSELFWPLPDEQAIIESSLEKIETLRQKKYFPKKEVDTTEQTTLKGKLPPNKNAKKPAPKKKPIKPVKGKKGAQEEEAVKIDILDWKNDSRTVIAFKDDFLGHQNVRQNPHNKFFVSGVKKLAVEVNLT